MSLRIALRPLTRAVARPTSQLRSFHASPLARTTAGYGDPQDEKADNHTPTPSSSSDPKPAGQGEGPGTKSGTTDPEVSKGSMGNAGGEKGAGNKAEEDVSAKEVRETKKVGEEPKKTESGGAGPIGG
ncbi:hypothetical protein IAU60_005104 [Kwoniella sp. DSM 27419]